MCQEEVTVSNSQYGKLKKKKRDKEKQSNKKAVKSEIDADKDVDEREESLPKHTKEKKSNRKWFWTLQWKVWKVWTALGVNMNILQVTTQVISGKCVLLSRITKPCYTSDYEWLLEK